MSSSTWGPVSTLKKCEAPFPSLYYKAHTVTAALTAFAAQDIKGATQFYEDKVKELAGSIQELEAIVQNKTSSLRVVEEGEKTSVVDSRIRNWDASCVCTCCFAICADMPLVLRQKVLAGSA